MGDGVREENGALRAMDGVGVELNGFEHNRVRELDINASPGTPEDGHKEERGNCAELPNGSDSINACEDGVIKVEPDTPSGSNQEIALRNGGDVATHANVDDLTKDGKDAPVDGPPKKRRLSMEEHATPDMPLRRSARRAAATTLLSPPSAQFSSKSAPAEKAALEKKCSVEISEKILLLPPSSKDLELDGLPVLDVFSVYTCLRSFSTLLFLSPFTLKAFVAALKCNFANSLMDSVHYSILQALKPHLEVLSEEGSQSACDCLRNLNWELLDTANWPLYLAEYLLIHHSAMSSGLKLMNGEYHTQPATIKLEILRNLCDDVIEVEIIRSELNRRMEPEVNVDTGQNIDIESKGKDVSMIDLQSPISSKDVFEEVSDGNSDECCLCKMDGSLICCDGCPAAFHLRCVGMARDLLPEGKWFCPECLVGKVDRDLKTSKAFQGAEILGIDAHGRIYFGSCGYLLVSESSDMHTSYRYYNKDDLNSILELLKASYISHAHIICSILVHWGIPMLSYGSFLHINRDGHEEYVDIAHESSLIVPSLKDELVEGESMVETKQHTNSRHSCNYDQSCTVLESCKINSATTGQLSGLTCPDAYSQGSATLVQVHGCSVISMSQRSEATCSTDSPDIADVDLPSKCNDLMQVKHNEPPNLNHALLASEKNNGTTEVHLELGDYVNCYSFGRIASSVSELISKSSDNITKDGKVSVEDLMSAQIRAIYRKSINHYWSAIQKLPVNSQKESCGWCFSCKNASEQECLFRMIENKVLVGSRNRSFGLHAKDKRKSHILYVVHHILHIEDNIHGLLSGPWQNPHHKRQWRKYVFKAADITSLKYLLLTLELHLRRIALSAEWMKPVDSDLTVGSASYVLTSERGGGRKHARKNISETKRIPDSGFCSVSNSPSTSSIYWWRGGRLSRQVFHWKMLPQSLASKGGRQAGCRKIPGILYPEGSEFAKRSKYVAWRAAVEMSQNVAQLAYQVKDLDSNIRWSDLSNSQPLPQLVKESRKSLRPLWKATICQKCVEGAHVKYLLDFGKRKSIPDVVAKHGVLQREPSSEMKKYWLDEIHIPINLLKAFEARKLEQLLKRTSLELASNEAGKCQMAKPRRKRGLFHLLSRGEKSDQNLCGHCDKVVLEREEVVHCQFCKGLIHKKHFRVPKGAITTTYTCYACKDRKFLNERKDDKILDGCKDKKILNESKDKGPVDVSKGKNFFNGSKDKKRMDGCKGKKSAIDGKNKKGVDKDENFFHEKKGKRLVEGYKGKKLSNGCKGKKIVDGYRNKKSVDGHKDNKFVNDLKDKKLGSRPKRRKRKLGRNKVLIIRKSERLAKKKQMVAKSKKRKMGCKKAKKSKTREDKQVVSKMSKDEISWHKGQRTGICPPYWLNGLLWTRKAYDEQAVHFRETRVLLPFPNSKDNLQPVCSLCHKEYDSHVIYVGCGNCGDWFHGGAFALTLVNINNVRGFKCHRCRSKSTPVCPFLSGVVDEVNLSKEKNSSFNHLGDYQRFPCLVCDNQDLLHDHYYSDGACSQKFTDEDQRAAVAIPDSGQIPILEDSNQSTSEMGPTEEGSHLVTQVEYLCTEHDDVKAIGEDHPF